MRFARFVYGVAIEDAAEMSPDGQCVPFKIRPRMFSNGNRLTEVAGQDAELTILNAGSAVSEGDEVAAITDISGFWTKLEAGGGASGQYVTFEFVDEASVSGSQSVPSSSQSGSDQSVLPSDCASRVLATGPYFGKVLNKACGMGAVPGESSGGFIELVDDLGIVEDRDYRDLSGRTGFAVRMQQESSGSASGSLSVQDECYWMIVIVNFWRTVTVVTDFVFDGLNFTIKKKNITVWDDCSLPDEILEGIDCEASASSASASAGSGPQDPEPPLPPSP